MEERREIELIFKKFLDHTCSEKEFEMLKQYLKKPGAESNIKRLMKEDGESIQQYRVLGNDNVSNESRLLFNKILHAVGNKEVSLLTERKRKESNGTRWYLPAFILVGAVVVSWLIYFVNRPEDIEISWMEKKTLAGQKATITLMDGTTVLLNSDSKLVYPRQFGDSREVVLEGEAFFMVARDEHKPFSIKSGGLTTTVLGTSFNVKAFQDEDIEVTVATGKVKVSQDGTLPDAQSQELVLTPNQQAVYDISGKHLAKGEVDADRYLAWREGIIRLDNIRFEEAAKLLERWYGVNIILENKRIGNCVIIGGEFQNQSLHKVLRTVELTLDITYEFTEDGVIIRGDGCRSK